MPEHKKWPKIPRLSEIRMWITEKIDGTNGQILVETRGPSDGTQHYAVTLIGSRKRAITPDDDHFGFAAWVRENEGPIADFLGPGRHFGEWAGPGIQKNPLGLSERRFFLFNHYRFTSERLAQAPPGISVVPLIYEGPLAVAMMHSACERVVNQSHVEGATAPGEGVVISTLGARIKLTPCPRRD